MKITIQEYTWHLILNPLAMSYKSVDFLHQVERILKELKIDYISHITKELPETQKIISSLCLQGERHFIVVGGDGTYNSFVNAIMGSGVNPSDIYMIPIILGTGNDWARTHFKKNNFSYTQQLIVSGLFIKHDIGLVEVWDREILKEKRYFINIAGFGFDAEVIFNSNDRKPRILPEAVYLFGLLKTLFRHKSNLVTIRTNGSCFSKDIFSIAVGIGQYNGNGMKQCPKGVPNDQLFEVIMIEKVSKLKVILNVMNLFDGSHVEKMKEIFTLKTDYLEIRSNPHLRGEVEGELLTTGDFKISMIKQQINILSELWS
ncbi:MAG TPA: YegS/Rv2252/BmrU family lipid kinase [Bacteroidales bacterium]|nr:YegS/Rv2252/BmrU family lipid kinase [Bacteroidales bacterium]